MRFSAIIVACALILAVLSPLGVPAMPLGVLSDGPVLTLDVCHPDAPYVAAGGLAPCLLPADPAAVPVMTVLFILPTHAESARASSRAPLPKPPRA